MASFVCPPPSSSLPPTPPHLLGRRRRRRSTARCAPPSLPSSIAGADPAPWRHRARPDPRRRPCSLAAKLRARGRPPVPAPAAAHAWPGACPCPCPQAAEPPRWSSWRPGSSLSSAPAVGSPAGRVHSPFRRSLQIRRAWTELAAARGWSRLPSADGCAQAEQAAAGARSKHAWRRGRAGERAEQARRSHGAFLLPLSSPAASSSAASWSERRILPGNAGARSGHRWTSARGRRRTAALGVATGGRAHTAAANGGARSGDRRTSTLGGIAGWRRPWVRIGDSGCGAEGEGGGHRWIRGGERKRKKSGPTSI